MWSLVIAIGVAMIPAIYFSAQPVSCGSFECFSTRMEACQRAVFVNEEPDASWEYRVLGTSGKQCDIRVTLLQAKEGELTLRNFEGDSMECSYSVGEVRYPDKDMARCSGKLKEDLQGLIITQLHRYIVSNIGEISEALQTISVPQGDENTEFA